MVRVLTYNVHSFVGTDRRRDRGRVARAIAESEARIVALQEVRFREAGEDAHALARLADDLKMDFAFQRTARFGEDEFGLAILTDRPMRLVKGGPLPRLGPAMPERRCALWCAVDVDGREVDVFCTHLAVLSARDRLAQAQALLGPDWIEAARNPAILMGDLNAGRSAAAYRRLAERLVCARAATPERHATFPSWMPLTRIDHIMGANGARFREPQALRTPTARVASDHLPFAAKLAFEDQD
ncbi:endonuclease/exonuclease/phosphatase family protein [Salinarimonas sp.]|uniref:endonuclease/exonuclease/phosphatase family protein n=1 Tax=Salinarimonas sp. TaxID=2766526 RepID=UPI00391929A0